MARTCLRPILTAMAFLALCFSALTPANAQWAYEKNSVYDWAVVSFPSSYAAGEIIVSFGDRRLYYVKETGKAISYPIAVPRPRSRWEGVLRVSNKQENPTWTPTPLMRKENPKLPAFVPGGHKLNPLGVRALYLGSTMYRIHGTDAPWTIGKNVSKGCVRMHNAHVIDLYKRVPVGAKVTATWKRFKTETVASLDGTGTRKRNWKRSVFGLN